MIVFVVVVLFCFECVLLFFVFFIVVCFLFCFVLFFCCFFFVGFFGCGRYCPFNLANLLLFLSKIIFAGCYGQ